MEKEYGQMVSYYEWEILKYEHLNYNIKNCNNYRNTIIIK